MLAAKLGKIQAFTLSKGFLPLNGSDLKDVCKHLLEEAREKQDQVHLNMLHLKLADIYLKEDFYESELEHLREAVAVIPTHYVSLFRLGAAFERKGDARNAMEYYERASRAAHDKSPELQAYALEQVYRIKKKGPKRKGNIAGLRYLPW